MKPGQHRITYFSPMAEAAQAQPIQAITEPEPTRDGLHTLEGGAWLPVMQAGITGLFIGAAALALAILFDFPKPGAWFLAGWVFSQAAIWLMLLWRWLGLTARAEQLLGVDLDGNGVVGPTLRVELARDLDGGGRQIAIMDLPTDPEKLSRLAQGLLSGLPLSEGTWTGRNGMFTRGEWRSIRAQLQARGLVRMADDRDHRAGYSLTEPGRVAMRYFASITDATAPIRRNE